MVRYIDKKGNPINPTATKRCRCGDEVRITRRYKGGDIFLNMEQIEAFTVNLDNVTAVPIKVWTEHKCKGNQNNDS